MKLWIFWRLHHIVGDWKSRMQVVQLLRVFIVSLLYRAFVKASFTLFGEVKLNAFLSQWCLLNLKLSLSHFFFISIVFSPSTIAKKEKKSLVSAHMMTSSTSYSLDTFHWLAGAQNAWDMLQDEESLMHITTSSADLDNILGGGIHCKEVTEIGWSHSLLLWTNWFIL